MAECFAPDWTFAAEDLMDINPEEHQPQREGWPDQELEGAVRDFQRGLVKSKQRRQAEFIYRELCKLDYWPNPLCSKDKRRILHAIVIGMGEV